MVVFIEGRVLQNIQINIYTQVKLIHKSCFGVTPLCFCYYCAEKQLWHIIPYFPLQNVFSA